MGVSVINIYKPTNRYKLVRSANNKKYIGLVKRSILLRKTELRMFKAVTLDVTKQETVRKCLVRMFIVLTPVRAWQ